VRYEELSRRIRIPEYLDIGRIFRVRVLMRLEDFIHPQEVTLYTSRIATMRVGLRYNKTLRTHKA
jgi:hypothetical protein